MIAAAAHLHGLPNNLHPLFLCVACSIDRPISCFYSYFFIHFSSLPTKLMTTDIVFLLINDTDDNKYLSSSCITNNVKL